MQLPAAGQAGQEQTVRCLEKEGPKGKKTSYADAVTHKRHKSTRAWIQSPTERGRLGLLYIVFFSDYKNQAGHDGAHL